MKKLLICALLLHGIFAVADKALYRREVTVSGKYGKKLTVKLQFYIPASCSGYRLLNRHGKEYGINEYYRQGSLVKIFFSARPGKKLQLVFYKDKVKQLSQKQTSGVLRRVKEFAGGNVRNLTMFKRLWGENPLRGARFEKNIFSGWNPFGPKKNSLHWYSAFIKIPRNGKWTFFSAAIDASFLLIDDKLVVNSPWRKWVRRGQEGKIRGSITLKKGIHRLDYLHANSNPNYCYAIAAALAPGAKKRDFTVLPENCYTPVLTAATGPLQTFSRKPAADFTWRISDMLELDGRQMYVVKFKTPCKKFLSWSPGGKTPEFNYFYFKPGEYPVELKCDMGKIKQNVLVDYQYMLKPVSGTKVKEFISEALKQERRYGIQGEGYAFLAAALIKLKMKKEAEIFYQGLLHKQNSVPPEITFSLFNNLVMQELLRKEAYEDAEQELKTLLKLIKSPKLRASANLARAELLFYCLGDISGAAKYSAETRRKDLTTELARTRCDLLRADLALMTKGPEAAAELYKKIKTVSTAPERRARLLQSGTMIAIQNCYILKKYETALEYVEKLEKSYPEVRLLPEYLLLKAKLFKQLKRPRRAAGILLRLLATDAPVLLAAGANWQLAQFYFKNKQYPSARTRLNNILRNAPRSREAAEAVILLKKIRKEELQR